MSTDLYENDNIKLLRYFGGIERGVLYSIYQKTGQNKKDVIKDLKKILKILENEQ